MKYLLILDLSGTLIGHIHITNRIKQERPDIFREYYSKINYIGRKLNSFLSNSDNRIAIISSVDHSEPEELEMVIKDINSTILGDNKERIEYYISDSSTKEEYRLRCTMGSHNKIIEVSKKELAYNSLLNNYSSYYPITVDDRPSKQCFSTILERGGECIFIKNELYSFSVPPECIPYFEKHYHLKDDIDRLIDYYVRSSRIFGFDYSETLDDMPDCFKFSAYDTYKKLHDGTLNIEELYNWLKLADIKKFFLEAGYSIDNINEFIKYHRIDYFKSFEAAYQKRILPKMNNK